MPNSSFTPAKLWNSTLYDTALQFVPELARDLIDLLGPQEGERILDVGCGTGELAQAIAARGAAVIGIDSDVNMVTAAQNKFPRGQWLVMDARQLDFSAMSFDAVFSNAVLHWLKAKDQPTVMAGLHHCLRPGGRLVIELGGFENIKTIVAVTEAVVRERGYTLPQEPWFYFPRLSEYASILEAQGFLVTTALLFKRPTKLSTAGDQGLFDWLETIMADTYLKPVPAKERWLVARAIAERTRPGLFKAEENSWYLDYVRLRIVAKRVIS